MGPGGRIHRLGGVRERWLREGIELIGGGGGGGVVLSLNYVTMKLIEELKC